MLTFPSPPSHWFVARALSPANPRGSLRQGSPYLSPSWHQVGWGRVESGLGSKGRCLPQPSVSGGAGTGCHISRYPSCYLYTCYAILSGGDSRFPTPGPKPPVSPLLFDLEDQILRTSVEKAKLWVDISFIRVLFLCILTQTIVSWLFIYTWFSWPYNMKICFVSPTARWFLIQNNWLCTLAAHTSMLIMWNLIRNYSQCQSLCKWRSDFTSSIGVISIFRINLWSTQIDIGIHVSTEGICVKLNACRLWKREYRREREKIAESPCTELLV